jgi:Flp pilus assembly protein TadG
MVEMVIVLPILLLLVFAIAEFSIAFFRWQTVSSAARVGAREASLFRPNCSLTVNAAVNQAVDEVLTQAGLASVTPALTGACISPGSSRVTVSIPYQFQILPNFLAGLGGGSGSINLTATSVMRNEFTGAGA